MLTKSRFNEVAEKATGKAFMQTKKLDKPALEKVKQSQSAIETAKAGKTPKADEAKPKKIDYKQDDRRYIAGPKSPKAEVEVPMIQKSNGKAYEKAINQAYMNVLTKSKPIAQETEKETFTKLRSGDYKDKAFKDILSRYYKVVNEGKKAINENEEEPATEPEVEGETAPETEETECNVCKVELEIAIECEDADMDKVLEAIKAAVEAIDVEAAGIPKLTVNSVVHGCGATAEEAEEAEETAEAEQTEETAEEPTEE